MSVPNLERRDGHRRQLDDLHMLYVRATRTDIDDANPEQWFLTEAFGRLGIDPSYAQPMWHHFSEMAHTEETRTLEANTLEMIILAREAASVPDAANWLVNKYQQRFDVDTRIALVMMERAVSLALDVEDLILFNRNAQFPGKPSQLN